MIGNFNLPLSKANANTYVYGAASYDAPSSVFRAMPQWNKPKGISFVYGLLIGAGSGGGGGFSFGAGTAGGGGGGGTPGGVIQFLQPAFMVPDTLFVVVPRGGSGGAASTAGGFPALGAFPNFTSLWFRTSQGTQQDRVVYVQSHGGMGGTQSGRTGTVSAGGAGGANFSAVGITALTGIAGLSVYSTTAALGGTAGGFGSAGTNRSFSGRPTGGAGGGGVSASIAYPGGDVLAPTTSAQSIWSRNLLGGANTGVAGEDGITLFEPTFFSLPGAGGGATLTGTGGNGGKGGIGCGGGGGGAGPTGGRGGDGGDGLVILACW